MYVTIREFTGPYVAPPAPSRLCVSVLFPSAAGVIPSPPASQPFPVPYSDDFNSYPVNSEARYFSDQPGAFEIAQSSDTAHGMVMRQKVRVLLPGSLSHTARRLCQSVLCCVLAGPVPLSVLGG